MGYIYKITNKLNNKIYIGQTIKERPTDRYSQHKYLANHPEQEKGVSYLHRAMVSDGLDNFYFEVIEQIENSLLNEREQYWIKYYDCTVPNGYNITKGGSGTLGYSRSQSIEEREKRQQSNKNYYINHPEAREKARQRTLELWKDEEYRKKVTESNKKTYAEHPELINRFCGENNPMYGKHHTAEALEKIRANAAQRKIKIAQLDKETLEVIQVYDGIRDAEKALGVSHGWLGRAAGTNKIAYGYRWKFI